MSAYAELSSISTALDDILHRVTVIAETLEGTERDNMSTELFEVERNLGAAQRILSRLFGSQAQ
jgi:hypothetical protein